MLYTLTQKHAAGCNNDVINGARLARRPQPQSSLQAFCVMTKYTYTINYFYRHTTISLQNRSRKYGVRATSTTEIKSGLMHTMHEMLLSRQLKLALEIKVLNV